MSNDFIVRVRRERSNATPTDLKFGELKFTDLDNRLHIGKADGSTASFGSVDSFSWNNLDDKPTTFSAFGTPLQVSDLPAGYNYNNLLNRPDTSALDEIEDYPTQGDFPATGAPQKLYIDLSTGYFYRWTATGYVQLTGLPPSWGFINGPIESQTDLKAKFDAQQAQISALTAAISSRPFVCAFSFNGDSVAILQAIDPETRVSNLNRSGTGTYTLSITGLTADSIYSIDSDRPMARLIPNNGTAVINTLNNSGNPTDSESVSVVIFAL